MFICIMPGRVEREEFERLRDLAETLGGWYSKPWGKTPGGFAFKSRANAETFANPEPSGDDDGPKGGSKPTQGALRADLAAKPSPAIGDKLRSLADAMQGEIDHKFADRQTNTPKRQREAQSARLDGMRLQRTQQALRALAAHHDAGTVPHELARVTSKKAAFDLVATHIERSGGYYDAGHDTGRPSLDTPATRAIFAMIQGQSAADKAAEELRRKVQSLQFANIPGYFPTPRAVVELMIDLADIPDNARILEPSAGSGAILDVLRECFPSARIAAVERHFTLREILAAKGHALVGDDFMESDLQIMWDRIIMNPPFENGQDAQHVMRAHSLLADGGRLVAVMSPGPFFRQDRKATEFRAWFDERGGEKYDLPAGSFKESGTGVGTVLVVIDAAS